jgi:hypothetical protein
VVRCTPAVNVSICTTDLTVSERSLNVGVLSIIIFFLPFRSRGEEQSFNAVSISIMGDTVSQCVLGFHTALMLMTGTAIFIQGRAMDEEHVVGVEDAASKKTDDALPDTAATRNNKKYDRALLFRWLAAASLTNAYLGYLAYTTAPSTSTEDGVNLRTLLMDIIALAHAFQCLAIWLEVPAKRKLWTDTLVLFNPHLYIALALATVRLGLLN